MARVRYITINCDKHSELLILDLSFSCKMSTILSNFTIIGQLQLGGKVPERFGFYEVI